MMINNVIRYSYSFPGPEGVEWKRGALRAVIVLYRELERTAFSLKLSNLAMVHSSLSFFTFVVCYLFVVYFLLFVYCLLCSNYAHFYLCFLSGINGFHLYCVETAIRESRYLNSSLNRH